MKYNFEEQSLYYKLWGSDEGKTILTYLIREVAEKEIAPTYFPTAFSIADGFIPTDNTGKAAFRVEAEYPAHSTMMDLRAPLGEGRLAEEGQAESYTGAIADFIAPVFREDSVGRKHKIDLFEALGDDAPILKGFATNELAPRIKAGFMTLDYMALMAETKGYVVYDKGVGDKLAVYKAPIPKDNFVKAGAKIWEAEDCQLLDQMVAIEEKFKDLWGVDFPRQWKVKKSLFHNVIMKNKQVIDTLKQNWLLDRGIATENVGTVSNFVVTEENFNRYVVAAIPGLSPIRIVDAKQMDNGVVVDPWPDGVATLSPAGYAGKILRTNILDVEMYQTGMLNNAVSVTSSTTSDSLMTVINYVLPKGMFKEWQTKVVMSATPVLTDFLYRVIVDTQTAE